ncbi:MAG: urease accessory protein UreD [Microvirga sp.]|nr:urease accessory protein UreD [Microvirga sp.]
MHATRSAHEPRLPRGIRARGGVRARIGAGPRGGVPMEIAESGGYRVRFLRGATCEGVFVNTGGGMAGGDVMRLDISLDAGAQAAFTTQAAEKIYRAQAEPTEIAVRLSLGAGARLDWLPQEQILFDRARLSRRLEATIAPDASLFLVESAVFGRTAMGERVIEGSFRDSWRIRRGGELVFAEEVRLEGQIAERLARAAVADGAHAMATCLFVAPGADTLLERARDALAGAAGPCAASALPGLLVARFLGRDAQAMRADLARFIEGLRGAPVPRSWMI